jgi:hypothetical protein
MGRCRRQDGHREGNDYRAGLACAKNAAGALLLYCRIPPAGQVDGVFSARQRQAYTTGPRREDHDVKTIPAGLEAINACLPRCAVNFTVPFGNICTSRLPAFTASAWALMVQLVSGTAAGVGGGRQGSIAAGDADFVVLRRCGIAISAS